MSDHAASATPTEMTIDLWLLTWSVVLCLAQVVIAASGSSLKWGLPTAAGNREDVAELTGWLGRAQRAHRNMLENLLLFAVLVLVAHAAGKANEMTALGAHLFFWARLAYAAIYVAGVPWVRTLLWVVSVVGMVIIFAQLF